MHRRSPSTRTPADTSTRRSGTSARSPRSASRSSAQDTASSPRSPAASRSAWRSRPCCADPTRCCCSTSRTTISTCRRSAGSRISCARRPRPCCSCRTTVSCSLERPTASSRSNPEAPGPRPGCTAAASAPTIRLAPTGWTGSTSCADGGTSSTRSCGPWWPTSRSRPRRTTASPRATRRRRHACASSRKRVPRRSVRRPRTSTCACAARARANGRWSRSAWS